MVLSVSTTPAKPTVEDGAFTALVVAVIDRGGGVGQEALARAPFFTMRMNGGGARLGLAGAGGFVEPAGGRRPALLSEGPLVGCRAGNQDPSAWFSQPGAPRRSWEI